MQDRSNILLPLIPKRNKRDHASRGKRDHVQDHEILPMTGFYIDLYIDVA